LIDLAVGVSVISVLAAGWCALVTTQSRPARLVRDVKTLTVEVERLLGANEAIQTRWAAKTHELEHLADQIAHDVERAEKKRRQASGAASRALRADPTQGPAEGSIEWARAKARSLGLN